MSIFGGWSHFFLGRENDLHTDDAKNWHVKNRSVNSANVKVSSTDVDS